MTSKTIYEIVEIDTVRVPVDVSLIRKSEDLFFNATEIAKQFDKQPCDFLRLDSTKEYIAEILKDSQSGNSRTEKSRFEKDSQFGNSRFENPEDSQFGNSRTENLVRVQNGGKYRGTWLHKELAFEFAGWLIDILSGLKAGDSYGAHAAHAA